MQSPAHHPAAYAAGSPVPCYTEPLLPMPRSWLLDPLPFFELVLCSGGQFLVVVLARLDGLAAVVDGYLALAGHFHCCFLNDDDRSLVDADPQQLRVGGHQLRHVFGPFASEEMLIDRDAL